MSFNVYREERRTWYAPDGSPSRRLGWYISWHDERSVTCFTSRADQKQFVAAVKQVSGVEEAWQAEEIAAAVALRTWGDCDEDRDFGGPCVHKALECVPDQSRQEINGFLDDLTAEWDPFTGGRSTARENAEHLKAILQQMQEEGVPGALPGMEALAAPATNRPAMER